MTFFIWFSGFFAAFSAAFALEHRYLWAAVCLGMAIASFCNAKASEKRP